MTTLYLIKRIPLKQWKRLASQVNKPECANLLHAFTWDNATSATFMTNFHSNILDCIKTVHNFVLRLEMCMCNAYAVISEFIGCISEFVEYRSY